MKAQLHAAIAFTLILATVGTSFKVNAQEASNSNTQSSAEQIGNASRTNACIYFMGKKRC